ncbi:hypothetical protein [Xanthomarina gelatinilytica]|uniref:hypothetical protein n=1 Tax=Xanthomarina gelatinilytica TaxID=1137281 RepID=UPI003AA815F7
MSNYDLINKLESLPYFNTLLKQGIIPMNWVDYKVIYEFYCSELERLKREKYRAGSIKRQAKENTAAEYSISERSVYLIIEKMRG